MIAQCHSIITNGIHESDCRLSLAEIYKIIVLYGIAGIYKKHILSL